MIDEIPVNPTTEEREGIARLALTKDGLLLHRYLRRVLEGCRVDNDHGALFRQEGARILARDMMLLMASGVEANRDRSSEPDTSVLTGSSRVAISGGNPRARSGAGRRVAIEPGDGWNGPAGGGTT